MSKTLPFGLQELLDSGATTLVYCWRVVRKDGVIQGFTEHDLDLTFDGLTYEASSGFTATQMVSELGLSVDNLNADGALSSDTISEDALASGRYDNAAVELYWVNFEDVAQRVLLLKGSIGEVRRQETAFSAELRSQAHLLAQRTGRTYRRYCDADLGDSRCGVDLSSGSFQSSGSTSGTFNGNRQFYTTGLGKVSGFFTLGKITFSSGLNAGLTIPVKTHAIGAGLTLVTLWEPAPFTIANGTSFTIFAGCDKSRATCNSKFSNIVRFRGFPDIPGNDSLTATPGQGDAGLNGGSRRNG